MSNINRRNFLASSAGLGLTGSMLGLSQLSANKSWAADTSGYKAIVCILLLGGMDHADTIIPFDLTSWQQLRDTRQNLFAAYNADDPTSTRNINNLLKLDPDNAASFGGREFSLPPQLSGMRDMFDDGDMAIIGGVGPLIEPVTRAEIESDTAVLPQRLFSHNDQQSAWTTLRVEGSPTGWGGRFADATLASRPTDDPTFAVVTPTGNQSFLTGNLARPFGISTNGVRLPDLSNTDSFLGADADNDDTRARLQEYFEKTTTSSDNPLFADLATFGGRGVADADVLLAANAGRTPLLTTFPTSGLGKQLRAIAETIQIQSTLNISRQVFFATTGGFDTHSGQTSKLSGLHSNIANSVTAFRQALIEIGQWNNVTTFTSSDFGRTVPDNGDGTDHGWGGHQFVMGGAVNGKRIYGDIASPEIGSSYYTPSRGRLIPTTSVEQYAATLGSWFGLTESELASALPNLGNFSTPNLGFV